MKNFQIKNNNILTALLFISPALLGIFVFIIIPVICSFSLSFADWDLLNDIHFVGLSNYKAILSEKYFLQVLSNTFIYTIAVSVLGVIIPLILACILNTRIKGAELFKATLFIPYITPMIVVALVWQWIFDPNIGLANQVLSTNLNWLYDKHLAMPVLIFVSVWKLIGYNVIIFLSGLATINQELLESSKIDGANFFQTFKNITIPLLSSTIFFVIVITSISSFQAFDLIYMMTQGGPENSTNVMVYSIYKYAFQYFEVGKASAVAYILFTIIFFLVLVQWKLRKKMVYNEE
ncbi:TPA: sugar ABC transporter permease [Candidatus Gastranaerophilales bacterium HUM_9]|nr:MAG TPA: sugar ABC transporter permease [Candidatus Gastranaerophilales bacterium HUM_9]HBX34282.1 sugar ABC transporter permease [Cyanobacteria bacterium UBA11440]